MPESLGAQRYEQRPVPDDWRTVDLTATDATLPDTACALYVGGAGAVTVRMIHADADVVFTAVPVGTVLWGRFKTVRKLGTAATNLLVGIVL